MTDSERAEGRRPERADSDRGRDLREIMTEQEIREKEQRERLFERRFRRRDEEEREG